MKLGGVDAWHHEGLLNELARSEVELTSTWQETTMTSAAVKIGLAAVVAVETLSAEKFGVVTWLPIAVVTSLPRWEVTWHQCYGVETAHDARTDLNGVVTNDWSSLRPQRLASIADGYAAFGGG